MHTVQINPNAKFSSNEARYQAIIRKDRHADGDFVYAVKTTGVYCRPSCAARQPLLQNVSFYRMPADAERQGYRPCKRCRPNDQIREANHAAIVQRACELIAESPTPPSLDELAEHVGMSAHHFHRIFKSLVGLTPKAYAKAHRSGRMRNELSRGGSITSAIYNAGYQSSSGFYTEANQLLGMSPANFRNGGASARIRFAAGVCNLGSILVAASDWGICWIALGDDPELLLRELQDRFAKARLIGGDREFERIVAQIVAFIEQPTSNLNLPLHVHGTAFQHRVWSALNKIKPGQKLTYAQLAQTLGQPTAVRAVAGACAANTLAVAIPCHRVVRTDGSPSGYRWGIDRKKKLLYSETVSARRL